MPDQPALLPYPDPPLTDGVVVLRRWEQDDVGCVEEATQDPDIPKGTTVPATFTPTEGLAWIERQWVRHDEGRGLTSDHRRSFRRGARGGVLMARQPGTVEIGYWLIPRARGRGLGSRAVGLLARWALTETALARVEALVVPDNVASRRVLEKAGFLCEGELRSYLVFERQRADAFIYSLLPSDLS